MNTRDRIFRLIESAESETDPGKRMRKMAALRRLEQRLRGEGRGKA